MNFYTNRNTPKGNINAMMAAKCELCGLPLGKHNAETNECRSPNLNAPDSKQDIGLKFDTGKPPLSLIDRYALERIADVLAFGADKYEAHNWRKGLSQSRLIDAALRHLFAYADGEDLDSESGLSHLAHAGCCVVFALKMSHARPDLDDRKPE